MKTVDNFNLVKAIGGGAYGTVYICKVKYNEKIEPETKLRMRDGRKVACKMIPKKKMKSRIMKYLIQEIDIMMKTKHDNILRFLEAKKTTNNIYIFFEFCNGGDLRRLLDTRKGNLDEKLVKVIMKQIAHGLKHLNDNQCMHRDLKLDNILINFPDYNDEKTPTVPTKLLKEFDPDTENLEVVIGDLGFARSVAPEDMATSYCGTPLNMAPEIMMGEVYDTKVDIWSFGTMMYELLVGFAPFTGQDPNDLANNVNKGHYGIPKNIKLSLQCLDVLHKCLQFDKHKRLNHEDLVNHPFFCDENESEKINLSVSVGSDQDTFFNAPQDVKDIDKNNANMFNVKDSCLFNQTYQRALVKFQAKQEKGEAVIQQPEEPKNDEDDLSDAGSEDNMSDYKSILQESADPRINREFGEGEEVKVMIEFNANQGVEVMRSKHQVAEVQAEVENDKIELDESEKTQPSVIPNLVEKLEDEPVEVDEVKEEVEVQLVKEVEKPEPVEEPKKVEEDKDSESDEDEGLDFTVIDFNKELLKAQKLKPIVEEDEGLEASVNKSNPSKPAEELVKKPIEDEEDVLDDFEIVHFHDIKVIDNTYLIRTSV